MITIDLKGKLDFPRSILERAALATLVVSSTPDVDLTILLTGDDEIRSLNQKYLDNGSPTDVLSFPAGEIDPESGRVYLGDVVISLPQVIEQAANQHHEAQTEAQLLVVHGVLHLLGYDHVEPQEKNKMWQVQAEILAGLGLKVNIPDGN